MTSHEWQQLWEIKQTWLRSRRRKETLRASQCWEFFLGFLVFSSRSDSWQDKQLPESASDSCFRYSGGYLAILRHLVSELLTSHQNGSVARWRHWWPLFDITQTRWAAAPSLHPSWPPPPAIRRFVFIAKLTSRSFLSPLSRVMVTEFTAAASAGAAATCSAAPLTDPSWCGAPGPERWPRCCSIRAVLRSEFARWHQTPPSCLQVHVTAPLPSGTLPPRHYAGNWVTLDHVVSYCCLQTMLAWTDMIPHYRRSDCSFICLHVWFLTVVVPF